MTSTSWSNIYAITSTKIRLEYIRSRTSRKGLEYEVNRTSLASAIQADIAGNSHQTIHLAEVDEHHIHSCVLSVSQASGASNSLVPWVKQSIIHHHTNLRVRHRV